MERIGNSSHLQRHIEYIDHNDIDNKYLKQSLNNDVNESTSYLKESLNNETSKKDKSNDIDAIAQWLSERFGDGTGKQDPSWGFYCKVAWKIPRPTIDRLTATATEKGRNAGSLFNYLARREMGGR